jgi:hypothetical protein
MSPLTIPTAQPARCDEICFAKMNENVFLFLQLSIVFLTFILTTSGRQNDLVLVNLTLGNLTLVRYTLCQFCPTEIQ